MWTISGLYFSWTNIDEIHGDHFRNQEPQAASFTNLISPTDMANPRNVTSLEFKEIAGVPYYFINKNQ